MKTRRVMFLTAALALGAAFGAQAAINLTFDGTQYGDNTGGITVTYPTDTIGGSASRGGIFVGQIKMKPTIGPDLVTFCLSPQGNLNSGLYDSLTFDDAKSGRNPSSWANPGGIENASYLWYNFAGSITTSAQGAAMQLALWEMLYDSTGSGTVTGGGLGAGRFTAAGADAATLTAFNAYVASITSTSASAINSFYATHPGYVLRPQDANGQDLLNFISPVPEPTTVFAAAMSLLPIGLGLLRKLRQPQLM